MTRITDWSEQGILPLQDHDQDAELDLRFSMVGARVKGKDGASGTTVIGKQSGKGTVGTVHPWRYFQTTDRDERPMGSWSMAMPGVATADAVGGGGGGGTGATNATRYGGHTVGGAIVPGMRAPGETSTNPATSLSVKAQPVRKDDYKSDGRFEEVNHKLPEGYEGVKEGDLVILMAGTEEDSQHDLAYPLSPSVLIAVNKNPPADKGSKVYDLDPDGKVSDTRWARLQSMMRVVLMPGSLEGVATKPGNALAWQHTASGQDTLAGYGACYGRVEGGGGDEASTTAPGDPYGIGGALGGGTSYNGGTSNMRRNVPGSNPDPHNPNKWAGTGPGVQGPPGGG